MKATLEIINQMQMTDWMRKVLESKQATRRRLQQLPFAEKLKLLEKLRDRSLLIARSRLRGRPVMPSSRLSVSMMVTFRRRQPRGVGCCLFGALVTVGKLESALTPTLELALWCVSCPPIAHLQLPEGFP